MGLQGKSREELFEIWKKRIVIAKELHKEKVVDWADKIFMEYSGDNSSNIDTGEKYSQVCEVVQAIEQTIQPHLFFRNPKFSCTSKKPEWEKREALVAAVVNQEYTDIKKTGYKLELENELCVLDARLLPFGATETVWKVEGGLVEEKPEGLMDKLGSMITGKPVKPVMAPVIEKEIGHVTERVNPLKLLLDYSSTHITKQKFTVKICHGQKSDLMTARYETEKLKNIKEDTNLIPEYKGRDRFDREKYGSDPDFTGLTWYEIEDIENRVIHTIVDGVPDFIEFNAEHPLAEGSKYSYLWFITVPNKVYPVPPIKYYRKSAKEFSYVHSQVAEQIDKFLPKIGFDVNRLSKPDQEKWKAGGLGALVGFNGSPQGAWDILQPKVQDDMFKYLAMKKEMMNLEAGVNDYEVAIPEERKAKEAQIIDQGTKSRRFAPQRRVKSFLINQAHTIWQTLAANASEEQFVKVVGEDAEEWYNDPETGKNTWTKEDIAGDYAFDFDVEQITPLSEAERKQQNAINLETAIRPELRQAVLEKGYELDVIPALEKFYSENLGIKDKSKYLRKLDGLEPGDEHTLWMVGQYPGISEREMKDPKFLTKHFQAHEMFIQSPGFQSLPSELQQGAIAHFESYLPEMAKLQQQQAPKPQPDTPAREKMEAVA